MNKHLRLCAAGALVASGLFAGTALAVPMELISNGDFETGTFAGWTVSNQAGSSGNWFIDTPGTTTPSSGFATAANANGGSFYAVTDQSGSGARVLSQSFVVSPGAQSVILSFEMFRNDISGAGPIFGTLDFTGGGRQFATVDILTAGAGVFSTAGVDVVGNLVQGVDAGANPHAYTAYNFDITGLVSAGGTFQLRIGEVDNAGNLIAGVDNVSIQQTVPEPMTIVLLGLGLTGIGFVRGRRVH